MNRIALAAFAAAIFAACVGPLADEPEPTRDSPRFSRDEVYSRIQNHRLQTESVLERATPCTRSDVQYAGNGIWHCKDWRMDEHTGQLFTVR